MIAAELIPKLEMARTTGNIYLIVVARLVKGSDPAADGEALLSPMYGEIGTYKVIDIAGTDPQEVDIQATYNLDSVIAYMKSKIIAGNRDLISGGIIYPTFRPYDDEVTYPNAHNAFNTVTALFEQRVNKDILIET